MEVATLPLPLPGPGFISMTGGPLKGGKVGPALPFPPVGA